MILNKDVSFAVKLKNGKAVQNMDYMGYIGDMEHFNELKLYDERVSEIKILTFSLADKENFISLKMSMHLYSFNSFKFKPRIVLHYNNCVIFDQVLHVNNYNEVNFNVSFFEDKRLYPIMHKLLRALRRYSMSKEFRILVYAYDKEARA
jgi:hypothetical protein